MTMTDDTYEGWTNRETWAVALHINNDQGWQESVYEALREGMPRREQESQETFASLDMTFEPNDTWRANVAGEVIRENVEETLDALASGQGDSWDHAVSVFGDIGSMWRVDWAELGASFLEALKEDEGVASEREARKARGQVGWEGES